MYRPTVTYFLDELRIGRQSEAFGAMGLYFERAPDAADRHAAQSSDFGQFPRTPMRLAARWSLQCLNDDLLDLVVGDLARGTQSRLIIEVASSRVFRNRENCRPSPANNATSSPRTCYPTPRRMQDYSRATRQCRLAPRPALEQQFQSLSLFLVNINGCFGRPVRIQVGLRTRPLISCILTCPQIPHASLTQLRTRSRFNAPN